jgi:transcription antitermination factor NusG
MHKSFNTGWYVLYVRFSHEKKVHNLLQENQLESFLPMYKTVRQWSDRKKIIFKPLFPSYIFVKINSITDFNKALSVKGASAYIRFGKEYPLVTDKEIKQIKFLISKDDISDIEINTQIHKIGEKKRIIIGALSGIECEVLNVNNAHKIVVRIQSLQQDITATIPKHYLSGLPLAI